MFKQRDFQLEKKLPTEGILAPIAVFGIIFGIHTGIISNSLGAFDILTESQNHIFFHSSWFVAGIPAILYSLLKLKPLLHSTLGDKLLYFLLPSMFIVMMGVGIVNML
jgi:hypothetical protein